MKRIIPVILAISIILSFSGCTSFQSKSETNSLIDYTDDLGRTIKIPRKISRIAVTGPLSQSFIIPIASDLLIAKAEKIPDYTMNYYPQELQSLEVIGQLYGGAASIDSEKLLALSPDIVIDIGEGKKTIKEDLDELSNTLGIPFIHIEATTLDAASVYLKLGSLLNREDRGNELSAFLEKNLATVYEIMERVDKDNNAKSFLYSLSDDGLYIMAKGSFHGTPLKVIGNNVAELSNFTSSGDGTEVSLEQIYTWNPEELIIGSNIFYEAISTDSAWNKLPAVKKNNYHLVPQLPMCWLASRATFLYIEGLNWITQVLYPDYVDNDFKENIKDFFELFYRYNLNDEEYQLIIK